MTPTFALLLVLALDAPVDLSRFDPASGIRIERQGSSLRAEWAADGEKRHAAVFSLDPTKPLFGSFEVAGVAVMRDVRPVLTITTGSRTERANERYIFFDKPASRPTQTHEANFDLKTVRVESAGTRAAMHFSNLTAGPFTGELVVRLYSGSPFVHVEAALKNDGKLLAYIYDFQLEGAWKRVAWKSNETDQWVRASLEGEPKPVSVRNRAIFGETQTGSVAVFPPPHAFFFPRDHTVNFKFAQIGKNRLGLRQDPAGGPGHQGAFIPWFDAPAGKIQRMSAFVLASPEKPEAALERVKRYTNGDVFKTMEGRFTFTSHWHVRLAMNELNGNPAGPEVAKVFKAMNVNLVHLAEFHGDGNPADPGPKRLPQLKAMFDVCRKYSDERILFIPGEEANAQLNIPAPKGTHPGHWLYLFPRPVYLTLVRSNGVPFVEDIPPYGKVYHAGSEADMVEILRREKALAWTAHPRIKASFACPDAYKEKDWYQDDLWLGGAWKAMPADLSEPRLGVRVLDLLDDMNTWGQRKQVPGEVDTFELDATHELYGHMNINYLKLEKKPTFDDWSPVLGALRRGDFFTTTGEVLIHSFDARNAKVTAELEWTFPLSQVLIASWDGHEVKRQTIQVPDAREFGRRKFEWPLESSPKWVRLEAWDVAVNGAFTQPLWLQ
ncbi:MAG: hypothetical protein FJ398_02055 [Verrucomicrobia bacterium]|nr:hypothetical protein [Verrucomicrobiota bacterium]